MMGVSSLSSLENLQRYLNAKVVYNPPRDALVKPSQVQSVCGCLLLLLHASNARRYPLLFTAAKIIRVILPKLYKLLLLKYSICY